MFQLPTQNVVARGAALSAFTSRWGSGLGKGMYAKHGRGKMYLNFEHPKPSTGQDTHGDRCESVKAT